MMGMIKMDLPALEGAAAITDLIFLIIAACTPVSVDSRSAGGSSHTAISATRPG